MQAFHLGMCHLQDETAHEAQNSEGKERKGRDEGKRTM